MLYRTAYKWRPSRKAAAMTVSKHKAGEAMTDIVERLRAELPPGRAWCFEAADEIERLRAALEMIAGRRPCPDNLLGNTDIAILALVEDEIEPKVGHLIAAAPDLLAACRYIVDAGETGDEMTAIEKARTAIAKAEGRVLREQTE